MSEARMTDDARERVAKVYHAETCYEAFGRDVAWKDLKDPDRDYCRRVADRMLAALRDSEGREVVAEGYVRPSELPQPGEKAVFLTVFIDDTEGNRLPVLLVRDTPEARRALGLDERKG